MIQSFNPPPRAVVNTVITKKLFLDQMKLTPTEKKLIRDDISSIHMRIVLQPQTIGLMEYETEEYQYKQIVISEVVLNRQSVCFALARLLQQAFPYPLILLLKYGEEYMINWADKRINLADKSKRVVENLEFTRWINPVSTDSITKSFLNSLDITKPQCHNLKELFDILKNCFYMLAVANETGNYSEATPDNILYYREQMTLLTQNREEQKNIIEELKSETQFNVHLKLNEELKILQRLENKLYNNLNHKKHE
ncbi:MAG: hypothetical protein CVU12_09545 [Bacteroidetes bacterium HGW-Bacteroidetes-7]|jgi:hypothetical protein|nr:MAG: hypothetical protein CVU12_09545 [Bacteroidetes bacterium HGW-Bacteroidetes-7]